MATQYANGKIVTLGLVLALDAADRNSYVSGSTVWNDVSGNGYNGILTNGPTFDSNNGGSIVFDGSNDYVSGSIIPTASYNNGHTVMAFHKLTNVGFFPTIFGLGKMADASGDCINVGYSNNFGTLQAYLITTGGTYTAGIADNTLNKLTCVTTTWDGLAVNGTLKYYINKDVKSTITTQGLLNLDTIPSIYRVGNRRTLDIPFYGNIYNVLMYNRALTQQEINQNYDVIKKRFGL
jgi:hypothetical protein